MYELGVAGSRSRPGVSNDNPYIESLFRTLKYCPRRPSESFESLVAASKWVASFVHWYHKEHRHSRIKFVTPDLRHRGEDKQILIERQGQYESMRKKKPNRWSGKIRDWSMQCAVELNPDQTKEEA